MKIKFASSPRFAKSNKIMAFTVFSYLISFVLEILTFV